MSGIPQDFRDWRHRLQDLQDLQAIPRHSSWVTKLHAKVLRYFISRYDYQPLPIPPSKMARLPHATQAADCEKIQRRLRERNEESYRRGEECRDILVEIHSTNALRPRHND